MTSASNDSGKSQLEIESNADERTTLVDQFEVALRDLKRLIEIWSKWLDKKGYTDAETAEVGDLYDRLIPIMGVLEPPTTELTGKRVLVQFGKPMDLWSMALDRVAPSTFGTTYLRMLADLLLEAKGRLAAGASLHPRLMPAALRIFVSHGGRTPARDKLEKFIRALGSEPIIVEDEPNLGASVSGKVEREVKSAQYGIVLGTADRGSEQDGKAFPRLNVIDEIPRLQSILGRDHVLVLLEEGVNLPTNTSELVRARFSQESMDEAVTQLVTELRGLGLLNVRSLV